MWCTVIMLNFPISERRPHYARGRLTPSVWAKFPPCSPWFTELKFELVWLAALVAFVSRSGAGGVWSDGGYLILLPAAAESQPTKRTVRTCCWFPSLARCFWAPSQPSAFSLKQPLPPTCLPALTHLQLQAADMISHSLINWENQSRGGRKCYWTSHNLLCDRPCAVNYTVHLQPLQFIQWDLTWSNKGL